MFSDLKKLGRDTLIYGLSTVVGRLLNVFLLPFYTHYLLPADYGVVATVFAYLAFLNVVYGYGMDLAFMRFSGRGAEGETQNFSTPFLSVAATSVLLSSIVYLAAAPLGRAVGLPDGSLGVVRISACILALDAIALVPFAELRLNRQAAAYAGIKIANIVINVVLTYFLLARKGLGVHGVFIAAVAASAASVTLLLPVIVRKLDFSFDRPLYGELLRFGLPLIPAGLASMVVQVIDRPILMAMTTGADVGIYTANYKLGIFMQLFVNMFDMAWRPFILPRGDDPATKKLIARVLTYFCAGGAFVVLAVSLFIKDFIALPLMGGKPLIARAYWSGLPVVPIVLLGYFFNGMYYNFLGPVNLAKRNDLVVVATGLGAVVNVGVNLILIPRMGFMGAAWATLAAYVAMAAALYALGQKVFPVDYEWGRVARVGAVFGVCGALAHRAAGASAAARAGVLACLPVALLLAGFFSHDEWEAVRRRLPRSA